jgi:D-alanyl-D-alanine carboxypeptidase
MASLLVRGSCHAEDARDGDRRPTCGDVWNDSAILDAMDNRRHSFEAYDMKTSWASRACLSPLLAFVVFLVACSPSAGGSLAPVGTSSPTVIAVTSPSNAATPRTTDIAPTPRPITLFPALPDGPLNATDAASLQKVLDDLVAGGAPDAIASVITTDGQWSGAAGIDGPKGRSAKASDEFNIASVSKPILAALVLRLVQDGKVDLDAPIASYLGDLPVDANKATVRQALAMRSGIGDTESAIQAEARADCAHAWTRTEVLRSIPAPYATAGSRYQYSNPSYKLLGYAVEHVTGKPLESSFQDLMFAPVSPDRILLQGASRSTPKPWALPLAGHEGALPLAMYGTGGTLPCLSISTFSFATSAVASDAPSLARWGWTLFTGRLIDLDSLVTMTSGDGQGGPLSFESSSGFNPDRALGVHGGQVGYSAFLFILPERQVVATVFINDEGANVESAARELILALGK